MADRAAPARRRSSGEAGSALLLMPAGVLIMIILGSLAVDRAVVFGAQRELVATAQAAANDAVALGVDLDALRGGDPAALDPELIDRAVATSVGADDDTIAVEWSIDEAGIEIVLERRVELVFASGVPGANDAVVIRARARAELRRS